MGVVSRGLIFLYMKMSREKKVRRELQWLFGIAIVVALVFWLSQTAPGAGQAPDVVSDTLSTSQGQQTNGKTANGTKKAVPNTVVGRASTLTEASMFNKLLVQTGVSSTISGKGPYALFLPTDAAMKLLPSGTLSGMTSGELKRFVEYHVITGRSVNADAVISGTVTALSGDPLNFQSSNAGSVSLVNSSRITATHTVGNGVIYVINQALLPPALPR